MINFINAIIKPSHKICVPISIKLYLTRAFYENFNICLWFLFIKKYFNFSIVFLIKNLSYLWYGFGCFFVLDLYDSILIQNLQVYFINNNSEIFYYFLEFEGNKKIFILVLVGNGMKHSERGVFIIFKRNFLREIRFYKIKYFFTHKEWVLGENGFYINKVVFDFEWLYVFKNNFDRIGVFFIINIFYFINFRRKLFLLRLFSSFSKHFIRIIFLSDLRVGSGGIVFYFKLCEFFEFFLLFKFFSVLLKANFFIILNQYNRNLRK